MVLTFRAIPGNVEDRWSMLKREPHDVFRGRMLSCRSLKLLATGTCAPSTGAPRLRSHPSPSWLLPHYTGESNPNQQYLFQNLSARCFSGQLLHVVTKNQTSNMSHAVFHSRDRLQQKVRCPFNQPWELNSKSWVWIDVSGRDLVALQLQGICHRAPWIAPWAKHGLTSTWLQGLSQTFLKSATRRSNRPWDLCGVQWVLHCHWVLASEALGQGCWHRCKVRNSICWSFVWRIAKNQDLQSLPKRTSPKKSGFVKSKYKLNKAHMYFYLPQVGYWFMQVWYQIWPQPLVHCCPIAEP